MNLLTTPSRLLRGRFAREVMTLQAGSLVTMGLQFVTSVVIANILGPSLLGTYYQARSLVDLVAMFANFAVGQALITPVAAAYARQDRTELLRLLGYFVKVGFAVAVIECAVGLIGGSILGEVVLADPEIGAMARVLFVSPVLVLGFNMTVLALQSSRQIRRLTLLENGALMGTSLLNVAVVAMGGGVTGLIYAAAFAPLLTSAVALAVYRNTLTRMIGFPTIMEIVRAVPSVPVGRYFTFSALVSIDKNFANLLALAPVLLLGRLAAADQLAFFRIAFNLMNFLSIPLAPIARNLYAKLAEITARGNPGELGRVLLKVTLVAGGVSVASSAAMMVLAPYILMIYRPEFMAALPVMYVLGVRFALLGFGVGLGAIYQVLGEMELALVTKVVPAIVMFGAGWILVEGYGAVGAAATLVIAYLIGDITNAFLVPHIVRRPRQTAVSSEQ